MRITFLCVHTPTQPCSLIKWNGAITGGSIFLSGDSSLLLSDVLLVNNTARRGGAVAAERASLLLLNHSTLIFNSASSGGAAVAASDQVPPSISSCRYRGCSFASVPPSQLHNQLSVSSFCSNPSFCSQAVVSAFSSEISWNRDPIGGQVHPPRIFQLIQRRIHTHASSTPARCNIIQATNRPAQVIGDATAIAFSSSSIITVPLASSADVPVYSRVSNAAASVQFAVAAAAVQAGNRPTAAATSAMTVCR